MARPSSLLTRIVWTILCFLVASTLVQVTASSKTTTSTTNHFDDDRDNDGARNSCLCEDPAWCRPIQIPLYSRKEVYAFSLQESEWKDYDWSVITTMAHGFQLSQESVCLAHSFGARVVFTTNIPGNLLHNNTFRTQEQRKAWVKHQVDQVEALGGDGLNVDYEDEVTFDDTATQQALTYITQLLQVELKTRNPYASLVWDFGWKPNVDDRNYEYDKLAAMCDYVFLMVYDTQSQILGGPPCLAGPNAPAEAVQKALQWYGPNKQQRRRQQMGLRQLSTTTEASLDIPYEKIILGLPWYGYSYNCTSFHPSSEECTIPAVPFRGVECSDAAGRQKDYPSTMADLEKAGAKAILDPETLSMKAFVTSTKVGNITDRTATSTVSWSTTTIAYYFDSPETIQAKVSLAWNLTDTRLGGVGMWNADVPNYTDPTQSKAFWSSMRLPPSRNSYASHLRQQAPPNILLLLTDDQDSLVGGMDHMPRLEKYLKRKGAVMDNFFVHTPICCPSRSSILSGRYLHNGGARNNSLTGNCYGEEWRQNAEKKTYAVLARKAGYRTAFVGKYLNQYGTTEQGKQDSQECVQQNESPGRCKLVPLGWDHWMGLVGNSRYYNYSVIQSDDAGLSISVQQHADVYQTDYFPDLVANHTLAMIEEFTKDSETPRPFLIATSWPTPHGPFTPAPQDKGHFAGYQAHRTPNFNTTAHQNSQKHWMMRRLAPIDAESEAEIDTRYQMRSEALQSIDRQIEVFVQALGKAGQLDNTIILYTSDNGWQFGQHRITGDKRQLYEHDIRVPMIIRGPGIAAGSVRHEPVLNIDIAPTIAEIVSGKSEPPPGMDGRSFWPLLVSDVNYGNQVPNTSAAWRTDFLVSYHGEAGGPCGMWNCPPPPPEMYHGGDATNNTYHCVRTLRLDTSSATAASATTSRELMTTLELDDASTAKNTIYCKFVDDESFVEYYDLNADPWQLHNAVHELSPNERFAYEFRLEQLKRCQGDTCRL